MRAVCYIFIIVITGCMPGWQRNAEQAGYGQAMQQANIEKNELPNGSTDVKWEGNGWVTFKWNGMKFLYQYQGTHGGHSAIERID